MSALLDPIATTLATHRPRRIPTVGVLRRAAVAAILREPAPGEPELLLIRRAENPRDRWSGHMAFPGGRVDEEDAGPFHAALRETVEEIGLDLAVHGRSLGTLSELVAKARGKVVPMVISPYVFALEHTPPLVPNREVQEVVWVPLRFFLEPSNRGSFTWTFAHAPLRLPCYEFGERRIWGLTLQMIDELAGVVQPVVPR